MLKSILKYFGYVPIEELNQHHCKCCSSAVVQCSRVYDHHLLNRLGNTIVYSRLLGGDNGRTKSNRARNRGRKA